MFVDESVRTGLVIRTRVIVEDNDGEVDTNDVGAFVLDHLWGGMGDYDEVVDQGDGVFEVITPSA